MHHNTGTQRISELSLRFLTLGGAPLAAPAEWTPALIEVDVPVDERHNVRLERNGVELPLIVRVVEGRERIIAEWTRSNPGHYKLELYAGDRTAEVLVTVDPKKIDREAFKRLLEDLENRLPAAVALGLQQTGALAGVRFLRPEQRTPAQELRRLRRAVSGVAGRIGLAQVLTALAHDPHHVLQTEERLVRIDQARRPNMRRVAIAMAEGRNLNSQGHPDKVMDMRVEHCVDVFENRLLRLFHHAVNTRLRRLCSIWEREVVSGDRELPTPHPLAEVREMQRVLTSARSEAGFLSEVGLPSTPADRTTMVLVRRAPYRAAHAGYLEFVHDAWVRLEDPALDAPLENLPHLYQVWCTLELVCAVLLIGMRHGYRTVFQRVVSRDPSGYYVRILPNGETIVRLRHPGTGIVASLTSERTFGRAVGVLHSISFDQRPDICLEVCRPGGQPRLYLFDPKYKLDSEQLGGDALTSGGQPQKSDIDKMHAYRDAIRGTDAVRVVEYAAILYPGPRMRFCGGSRVEVEAFRAYPGSQESLQEQLDEILTDCLRP